MKRLISLEFHKLRGYRAFWILFALYIGTLTITVLSLNGFLNSFFRDAMPEGLNAGWPLNSFPDSWHYLTYLAGFFHYILGVIVIILICNEFSFKTVRQNVIDGMSRAEWLMGKFLMLIIFALASTLVVFICIMVLGLFDTIGLESSDIFSKMHFIGLYFLQLVGYLMFAFVIGMLVRKTGIGIGVMFIYAWFLENISVYLVGRHISEDLAGFFPLESFNRLIPLPFNFSEGLTTTNPVAVGTSIGFILLFMGISYWFLSKRDL
jgi:ABC-type transport system involved in multi-copper enzyme maturation permease subunit